MPIAMAMGMASTRSCVLFWAAFVFPQIWTLNLISGQLIVNVINKGGDVLKQTISANTTVDTVELRFTKTDGTLLTQFIDFRNEMQIFKAMILPEMERGQTQVQILCFVTKFSKNDFISSDAMSKLRQKNPGAIRHPEEDRGSSVHQQDLRVMVRHALPLTPHVTYLCENAPFSTFTTESDLRSVSKSLSKDFSLLLGAAKRLPAHKPLRCKDTSDLTQSCVCRYEVCIGWYPCGLKYCRGKDSAGRVVSYRCGIKTCSRCRIFDYFVAQKHQCIWDEP